jgi:hypothetical protein
MDTGVIITVTGLAITIGGICIAFGVLKAKIAQNERLNEEQQKGLGIRASKDDLAAVVKRGDEKLAEAIRHSDELLALMQKRAEEDRARGEGRYSELYSIINSHNERIGKLEVSQEQLFKMLDKLETTVTTGFREMKDDMKELREALKQK